MKKKSMLLALFTLILIGNFAFGFSKELSKSNDFDAMPAEGCVKGFTMDDGFGVGGYFDCCVAASLNSCCTFGEGSEIGTCPQPPPG